MKTSNRLLLLGLFFAYFHQGGFAQTSDYAQVEMCIENYLKGDTQKDFETLKPSFHPNATMKYVSSKSGYQEYNALEVFKGDLGREPEKNRTDSIAYINITGRAAQAKVEVNYPTITVVDYLHLLKIEGKWTIVNKIFSSKPSPNRE